MAGRTFISSGPSCRSSTTPMMVSAGGPSIRMLLADRIFRWEILFLKGAVDDRDLRLRHVLALSKLAPTQKPCPQSAQSSWRSQTGHWPRFVL